jgi:23S rRNA (guanine745-N1)-methyltransferase
MVSGGILICPICSAPLAAEAKTLRCAQGHNFDRARAGYVNLLSTKRSGDSREMLLARRAFLDRGYYAPLAEAVSKLVGTSLALLPHPPRRDVLDAGCGEGYYLDHLQRHSTLALPEMSIGYWGLDSSRDAIQLAARRNRTNSLIVADLKERLPFATHAFQAVLCIFAPRNPGEFARVLAPEGLLLVVIPGPEHIQELREPLELLSMEENKRAHVIEVHAEWFTLVEEASLIFTLDLDPEDMRLLVTMSPSHRHVSDQREVALQTLGRVRVTAAFMLLAFQRRPS